MQLPSVSSPTSPTGDQPPSDSLLTEPELQILAVGHMISGPLMGYTFTLLLQDAREGTLLRSWIKLID